MSNWPVGQPAQGLCRGPAPRRQVPPSPPSTSPRLTDLGVVLVDVLVVGHLHEPVAQVVVGEDEEAAFQVTIDHLQVLEGHRGSRAQLGPASLLCPTTRLPCCPLCPHPAALPPTVFAAPVPRGPAIPLPRHPTMACSPTALPPRCALLPTGPHHAATPLPAVPRCPPCSPLPHLVMLEELQQEGSHGGGDTDEEVDDNEEHVGRAGNLEPEGGRVHDGGDRPPAGEGAVVSSWPAPPRPTPRRAPPYP